MPGGYGVICSAAMRPSAWLAGTISVSPKNASRGSSTVSSWSSSGVGSSTGCAGGNVMAASGNAQRVEQPPGGVVVVRDRHGRQNAAVVAHPDVDPTVCA